MLVFCCCITNEPNFSNLRQHPFISTQVCRSEVWTWHDRVLCSGSQETEIKMLDGVGSHLWLKDLVQAYSDYWKNLVPCGCRTEVPVSL